LAPDLVAAGVDHVFLVGPIMRELNAELPERLRAGHWGESTLVVQPLLGALRAGDVVLVKGSLGTRMAPIVEALRAVDQATVKRPKAANGD
jgi:UDP-N-acetylmuramoyl-tripeptide--D-alanyl-D-alanine ligase